MNFIDGFYCAHLHGQSFVSTRTRRKPSISKSSVTYQSEVDPELKSDIEFKCIKCLTCIKIPHPHGISIHLYSCCQHSPALDTCTKHLHSSHMNQLAITPPLKRRSARHSNQENQKQLREKIIQVATTIYKRDGIEALTMRSVAKQVGMSAMGLYYYFNDKSELLVALWDSILDELHIQVARAIDGEGSARERLRLSIDANLSYWEAHPENFRLVYMSEQTVRGEHSQKLTMSSSYQNVISISLPLIEQVAIEINGDLRQAPLARDLRLSLMVGFLHSALINVRYPWIDLAKLRAHAIESIAIAVEHCLAQNLQE